MEPTISTPQNPVIVFMDTHVSTMIIAGVMVIMALGIGLLIRHRRRHDNDSAA